MLHYTDHFHCWAFTFLKGLTSSLLFLVLAKTENNVHMRKKGPIFLLSKSLQLQFKLLGVALHEVHFVAGRQSQGNAHACIIHSSSFS